MEFYNLQEGVYLVEGHVNGCIYDLNRETLYEITKDLKDGLVELIKNNVIFHESFKPIIDQLMELQILEINEVQRGLKEITELGDKQRQIESAWINVTDRCNLRCIHCFQEASPDSTGDMGLEEFKKVVDELSEHNVKTVTIFGGEPLVLGDKLVEMMDYSRDQFEVFEIFTNGTLIDDDWIEVFKKYNPFIRLSLHSFIKEEQDKVSTVPGSYDQIYQAIELMEENEISHVVVMSLMKGVQLGEKNINSDIISDIVKLAGRADMDILDRDLLRKKLIVREAFTRPLKVNKIKRNLCQHGCYGKKLYIDVDLDAYPCPSEQDLKHGNLKQDSLMDILKDEIIYFNNDKLEICSQCEYRYACISCRSDDWNNTKRKQPWFCTYDPITGEWEDVESFIDKLEVS